MNFTNIPQIQAAGFTGFKTMKELFKDHLVIPQVRGVYLVLNPTKEKEFVETGTGGHFKGKNPNVSIPELEKNWVEEASWSISGKQVEKERAQHSNHD